MKGAIELLGKNYYSLMPDVGGDKPTVWALTVAQLEALVQRARGETVEACKDVVNGLRFGGPVDLRSVVARIDAIPLTAQPAPEDRKGERR